MATYTDPTTGIYYSNISQRRAKGYPGLITNENNVTEDNYYDYKAASPKLIVALDIDFAGAQIHDINNQTVTINNISDLLYQIQQHAQAIRQLS